MTFIEEVEELKRAVKALLRVLYYESKLNVLCEALSKMRIPNF
jgi:hypothetical protein